MSKPRGPRLWLKSAEYDKHNGAIRKNAVWCIKDGDKRLVTGCSEHDVAKAEQALAAYLAEKHAIATPEESLPARDIYVTDVLRLYLEYVVPRHARPILAMQNIATLGAWWAGKKLSQVNEISCVGYVRYRCAQPRRNSKPAKTGKPPRMVTAAGARRELEDMRSAINWHRRAGLCREVIEVWLPNRSPAKERWLTRDEVALLLWTAWRHVERQNGKPTRKRPWRHLARFILAAVYTGSRPGVVVGAALTVREGSGYVDLKNGVFYRRAQGQAETNKRRPPIRLPSRALAHFRRWATDRGDATISKQWLIEYGGERIADLNNGFTSLVKEAKLGKEVTPHTLRHTAATWLMQSGADLWDSAGFLGMSVATLERVYGHHHPDHQRTAVENLGRKTR